jgi:hypothetical protein
VRARREEIVQRAPGYRATLGRGPHIQSWMNRVRALPVSWPMQTANYEGSLHFACAYFAFARAGILE